MLTKNGLTHERRVKMKKKVEMKNDGKDFKRFDDLLSNVVKIPKDEIDKREKKTKEAKKKGKP